MSNFLRDPNDPPAEAPAAPETDADGLLPWESAPEDGYPAATTGGEGEAPAEEGEEGGAPAEEGAATTEEGEAPAEEEAAEEQAEEAPAEEAEPEPDPSLEASAEASDDGQGEPGPPPYYLPPDETIEVDYEVRVQPPPADRAEAIVFKHRLGGEEASRHTLVNTGGSHLSVPLTGLTAADSPLWIRFEFEKAGAPRPLVKVERAFSLAEPEVAELDIRREVVAGEAHDLKVKTWGALAYDRPGQPTFFATPAVDAAKVSEAQKGEVKWRINNRLVADLTGAEVQHTFEARDEGKKIVIESWRKTARGRRAARAEVCIGKLRIHGAGRPTGSRRPAPSAIVPLDADLQFKAYLDPPELARDATFTWEASDAKVTLTPGEGGLVTAHGATESESDGDVTLTVKATVNGVEWTATHAVSVKKMPLIKAGDGTSDPTKFAPEWHFVYFKAVVPEGLTGTFSWEVSDKLQIKNSSAAKQKVTVMARAVSDAAEDQWVKVTFTPTGGTALTPVEHKVTAVSVVFSKDPNQRYGFDNMDHATGQPPRLSVKKNDYTTVKVTLRGPSFTSEKVTFTSDTPAKAEPVAPAAGAAEFALRINGKAHNKEEVAIRARVEGATGPICATINVCIYKEFALNATVYRVHDSTVAATAVAAYDLAAGQTLMNDWYKAAVVRCTLTDGGLKDCNYDKNSNGMCELGANGGVSVEETTVTAAIGAAAGQRAVIVKDVNWRFTLTTAVAAGGTSLVFDQAGFMNAGARYRITDPSNGTNEVLTVGSLAAGAPGTLTIAAPGTTNAYTVGSYIDWPLAGRGGNPCWIETTGANANIITCTLAHELGHSVLGFKDLSQAGLVMNFSTQDNANLTFRYKAMARHYNPPGGTENQWDVVSRA